MKNFSSKGIRFSGDSIKSCVCFIDLVDSTKNTITMDGLEYTRKYYSTFINTVSDLFKSSNGKIIKNMGDCLLVYFPKTSDPNSVEAFSEVIECGFRILDKRFSINQELSKQYLPPFNYRISMDYGVLDLALVGDYSQIDLFGSTVNICSKINSSSSLAPQNEIVIGDNFYRILKSFSNIVNKYDFINNGEYKITEISRYLTYNIKRKNTISLGSTNINEKQLSPFVSDSLDSSYNKNEQGLFFHKGRNNKRVILVDDEKDILFTYTIFLKDYDYHITHFTDPILALNHIREIPNFDNLLVILDIRMKNLNGIQLHQQIKAIDPKIKIIFVTALDILDELLSIVPGISKEQIMRKPVDKSEFTNTVKKFLN
jgi:CheY-like chemotaxis protein